VVQGDLAAMLQLATNAKRPSESDDLYIPALLVAGAGFEPFSGSPAKLLMACGFWS
jgi:hypothetical protein